MEGNINSLKRGESVVVGTAMMILMILLFIPGIIVLILKLLYTTFTSVKEESKVPEKIPFELKRHDISN